MKMASQNNKRKKALHKAKQAGNKSSQGIQLLPDYGSYYLKTRGLTPMMVQIAHPMIHVGSKEANITFSAYGYMATLITTPEFGRSYQQDTSQMLSIIPDPGDAYTTPLGELVVPFKLTS